MKAFKLENEKRNAMKSASAALKQLKRHQLVAWHQWRWRRQQNQPAKSESKKNGGSGVKAEKASENEASCGGHRKAECRSGGFSGNGNENNGGAGGSAESIRHERIESNERNGENENGSEGISKRKRQWRNNGNGVASMK